MSLSPTESSLHALARQYGVDTRYIDIWGDARAATPEALLRILQSLGAPLSSLSDVPDALRHRQRSEWQRHVEPVQVAWDGHLGTVELRAPAELEDARCSYYLKLESGEQQSWTTGLRDLATIRGAIVDGTTYQVKRLPLPDTLPIGYHTLVVDLGDRRETARIISAPGRAWTHPEGSGGVRRWGVFMPLHALRTAQTPWGGHLGDLETLMSWTANLGGSLVGTLPLLAAFLDEPFDPSPYAPASRLFWNELFLDLRQIPDLQRSDAARILLATLPPQHYDPSEIERVDYRAWARHQRAVLEALTDTFFGQGGEADPGFRSFLSQHPRAIDYARFRAAAERHKSGWIVWPERERNGDIRESDYDPARERYHLYAQWRLDQQLSTLGDCAKRAGAELYLDFPLGVHPDSYDTWRERDSFASGISVGAPPDMFFSAGQNWGFPPLHPERIREHGYGYLIEAIRNHTRHAGALRIDHVMGLLRLYWIPHSMGAVEGTYVHYPADELYAILSLESRRAQCLVVGEDLGTVPDSVRAAMTQHDFLRMYVAQFEMREDPEQALNPPPTTAMASLNTHDTVLFAGFWDGLDVEIMRKLELIDDDDEKQRHTERTRLMQSVCEYLRRVHLAEGPDSASLALRGILRHLAASPAQVVMVTLEDLWLETQPQNVPGTGDDWGNWRRKSRRSLDELRADLELSAILQEINRLRSSNPS